MKSFNTTESIGDELDLLYSEIEAGPLETEDARALNMKLAVLRQRADLIKSNVLEMKLEEVERMVRERFGPRRVA
jgi:hypothetical protein